MELIAPFVLLGAVAALCCVGSWIGSLIKGSGSLAERHHSHGAIFGSDHGPRICTNCWAVASEHNIDDNGRVTCRD